MNAPGRRAPRKAALLLGALALAGCVHVQLEQPVADFAGAVAEARSAMRSSLQAVNAYERRMYLDEALFDPSMDIADVKNGKRTPLLAPVFPPESIRARLDALDLVGEYAQRLQDLVTDDAPARATDAGAALGKNLAGLGERVAALSGDRSSQGYAGPISTAVAVLGEMWVAEKRDRALRAAIERGAPAVGRIIDLLEQDLVEAVRLLRRSGERERLALRVSWYNRHRAKLAEDLAARREQLADVEAAVARFEDAASFDPVRITGPLREANDALLAAARSPRRPEDLKQLAAAMKALAARVRAGAEAARKLQDAKEQTNAG
ncbi:MAG TPA: hypothetical protein VIV57_00725 [Anaeromyxobacter sp.]